MGFHWLKTLMKKLLFFIAIAAGILQSDLQAQGIRRSVISSFGDSGSAGGFRMACTAAQPPNAGTISGGVVTLRQGFQQPPNTSGIDPNCIGAPLASFSSDNFIDVCGEKFSFFFGDTPDPATTFSWNFGQDAMPPTSLLENPLGIVYASTGVKTITLQVTTGACISTTTQTINVTKASFGATSSNTNLLCYDDKNGNAQLSVVNAINPVTYKWSTGANTSAIGNLTPGNYGFTVTDAIGCSFSSEANIGGPDSLALGASSTVESCDENQQGNQDASISLTMSGGVAPYTFQWSNGLATEDLVNLGEGFYSLTVTDEAGCEKTRIFQVTKVCENIPKDFVFPNLITPNGDGANDAFVIPGLEDYPENDLTIFTRWGNQVFFVKGYSNDWQGNNDKGEELPVGAYFYVLRLNDLQNRVFDGSISILR